jgi:capsular exopolysaccharide synthesis family protein
VVLITSPAAGEGKTTTAVNLAVALSGADRHVVVVDCDLRRPRVHEIFDLPPDPGFTSLLLGRATLTDAVHIVATQERLAALPSGPVPPNPSELLASRATEVVLQSLRSEADAVIIDSPPVLPVTDALVLGRLVDGVVVVVRAGKSTKKELRRTLELLRLGEVRVLGLVLNGTREDRRDHYRYSYVSNGAPGPVTGGGAAAL